MDTLTKQTIETLLQEEPGLAVSLYLPTSPRKALADQNLIRLKNLTDEAESLLLARGISASDARERLEPIRQLADDMAFWQGADEGLAIFQAHNVSLFLRLPCNFEEFVAVGRWFHIAPLAQLLNRECEFSILAVSQNDVRLLQATFNHVSRTVVSGLPKNLAESLNLQKEETTRQTHGGISHGAGGFETVFHGQGAAADHLKPQLLQYFRTIDHAICQHFHGRKVPLIFAGVDYLFPIYQQANHYPGLLLSEHVSGNPDLLSDQDLLDKAKVIAEPLTRQTANRVAGLVADLMGTDCCVATVEETVRAAHRGLVGDLLITRDLHEWGSYEPASGQVFQYYNRGPRHDDLVNLAVIQTLRHGGNVLVYEDGQLPERRPLLAHLRYAASVRH